MTVTTEAPPKQDAGASPAAAPPAARPTGILVGIGLDAATTQRITNAGVFDVSTEPAHIPRAHLVAISTRPVNGQPPSVPEDVDAVDTPVVVICHPGGEENALSLMQQGCSGVVAEGNEGALAAFENPEAHTDILVEGFLEKQGQGQGAGRYRDPVTNLLETASFEVRLVEMIEAGPPPNVILMQVSNLETARALTDSRAVNLVRRRLASFFSDAAQQCGAELFSLDEATFALLDGKRCITDAATLASEMIAITEAFRPAGLQLHLAVGAVSASEESDPIFVQEQAEYAVMAAARGNASAFVTADQVTVLLASATEYNVAQLLVGLVDQKLPNPDGHSGRVSDLACAIAREHGFADDDLTNLQLAALLHDIGRISLDGSDQDALGYPERGARYVVASAGPEIADAIRHQAERWDGEGPGGLSQDEIPLGARIIAIADAADTWLHPPEATDAVPATEIGVKIQDAAGSQFDPALVETALRVFAAPS